MLLRLSRLVAHTGVALPPADASSKKNMGAAKEASRVIALASPGEGANSLQQAIYCLQQGVSHAASYALIAAISTYGAIRLAEATNVQFSRRFLRRGRWSLPMGLGLVAACIGGKQGISHGIVTIEAESGQQQRQGAADGDDAFPASRDADGRPSMAELLGMDALFQAETQAEVQANKRLRTLLDGLYASGAGGSDAEEEDVARIPLADQRAIAASGGHEAYGELTVRGGHDVVKLLRMSAGDVLFDLGAGASRFIAQACLEVPGLTGVGVELSEARHRLAAAAATRPGWPPLASARQGDALKASMGECTHVYLASLMFDAAFMARLAAKLAQQPKLTTVLTLKRFGEGELVGFEEVDVAAETGGRVVEVTWGAAKVFLYRRVAAVPAKT